MRFSRHIAVFSLLWAVVLPGRTRGRGSGSRGLLLQIVYHLTVSCFLPVKPVASLGPDRGESRGSREGKRGRQDAGARGIVARRGGSCGPLWVGGKASGPEAKQVAPKRGERAQRLRPGPVGLLPCGGSECYFFLVGGRQMSPHQNCRQFWPLAYLPW